jgi:hypothetical protein
MFTRKNGDQKQKDSRKLSLPLKIGSYVITNSSRVDPAIKLLLHRDYLNHIPFIPTQMHLSQINIPLTIQVRREHNAPMA